MIYLPASNFVIAVFIWFTVSFPIRLTENFPHMSTSNGKASAPTITPLLQQRKSGIRSALEYTGIPPSWFNKRPKLPSRNWLIFLSVTSSITGLYIYDRQQCKKIRREYVDRVKHLAEVPTDAMAWPRKVTVYGCKWPGDEEYDQSMKFFRKYVKVCLCP
jgi:import inner membrane translocase subunit TIM54